jgi:hypothetical protein
MVYNFADMDFEMYTSTVNVCESYVYWTVHHLDS